MFLFSVALGGSDRAALLGLGSGFQARIPICFRLEVPISYRVVFLVKMLLFLGWIVCFTGFWWFHFGLCPRGLWACCMDLPYVC